MGQILLYVIADGCCLISLWCLFNLGLKDKCWSGDVVKHMVRVSLGKKEEENNRFFDVFLLPTDREKGD